MKKQIIDWWWRSGGGFDSDYQTILDYATTQGYTLPSSAQQSVQNSLVVDLKAYGIWDELDVFYNFFTDGDHNFAKINWKAPGTFQAVGTGHEPTFTANSGFKGNAGSQYLDTTFSYFDGVGIQSSDPHLMVDVTTEQTASTEQTMVGAMGGAPFSRLYIRYIPSTDQSVYGCIVSANRQTSGGSVTSGAGMFLCRRIASGTTYFYRNAVLVESFALVSTGFTAPPISVYICGLNNGGSLTQQTDARISCVSIGGNLSGKESNFYNAWSTYKTNA